MQVNSWTNKNQSKESRLQRNRRIIREAEKLGLIEPRLPKAAKRPSRTDQLKEELLRAGEKLRAKSKCRLCGDGLSLEKREEGITVCAKCTLDAAARKAAKPPLKEPLEHSPCEKCGLTSRKSFYPDLPKFCKTCLRE